MIELIAGILLLAICVGPIAALYCITQRLKLDFELQKKDWQKEKEHLLLQVETIIQSEKQHKERYETSLDEGELLRQISKDYFGS